MSIAEMITQGGKQQSQSWSVLSENLGRLGQQVGNQLAMREYQKQAAESLPIIQEQMTKSLELAGKGKSAEAYSSLVPLITNPSFQQNPYTLPVINTMVGLVEKTATDSYKRSLMNMQYGGGVGSQSGLDRLRGVTTVEPASLPVFEAQETSPEQAIASFEDQTRYGAPTLDMEEEPYDTDLREAQIAEQIQTNPDLTQEQKQFAPQVLQFKKLDPAQKVEELNQSTTETVDTGFERVKVAGLEKIYPNLTGELGIPQVGTITKIKQTTSTSDAPGSKINYTFTPVETKVGESLYNHNIETYKTMGKAVNKMLNQAPIDSKEKFVNLFEKNGGIENAVVSPTTDPEVFNLFFNGNEKDQYEITSKQAEDIGIVQSIPATGGSGIRFVGTTKAPIEAAPAAGGLPAVQAQAPAPAAPEIPDVEGNPFAEKVKKIKTKETEEQKKVTTDEISRVVETASRLQQALEGLAKGKEYPAVMDYLPRAKKTALESSSVDALRSEYNLLASVKPAIEWLKNNPNHKDAARAAEVIRKKLGI